VNDLAAFIASLLAFAGLSYGASMSARLNARLRIAWRFFAIAALCMSIGNALYFMRRLGCQFVQGFYISSPLNAQAAAELLRTQKLENPSKLPITNFRNSLVSTPAWE
jgi:hypothetical protein